MENLNIYEKIESLITDRTETLRKQGINTTNLVQLRIDKTNLLSSGATSQESLDAIVTQVDRLNKAIIDAEAQNTIYSNKIAKIEYEIRDMLLDYQLESVVIVTGGLKVWVVGSTLMIEKA